ncbi:transposase [Candidatus Azambacteria bacterium]|nr:transposase [Candidatus Azambacteria bacterium]
MPNHFHLLLMQRETGGISKFMQKLGTGYTNYFNTKYKRNGVLLQGKFKAIAVRNDTYLTHLSRYIHLNPLDLTEPKWKENGISNWLKAKNSLEIYKWSSYGDYVGKPRYTKILAHDFLKKYFSARREYASFVQSWTNKTLYAMKELTLE